VRAAQAATTPDSESRRQAWQTASDSAVQAQMFRDQTEVDALWQEAVQWLQLQQFCMELVVEASHVPDATTPDGAPTTADNIAEALRAEGDTRADLALIESHMDRQVREYMPPLPAGVDSFQYLVQHSTNLLYGMWEPGHAPDAVVDGVPVDQWRLASKAEVTFLVAQLGGPAPYDTTVDCMIRKTPSRETDQEFVMQAQGRDGPQRLLDDRDYAGLTTSDARMTAWRDKNVREMRDGFLESRWNANFWPRANVTKPVWQQAGRFGGAGVDCLAFAVTEAPNSVVTPGRNASSDAQVVYRSDLNWFVPRGNDVAQPTKYNQPNLEVRVRTYDTRSGAGRAIGSQRYADGRFLQPANGADQGAWWMIEGGRRHWIATQSVAKSFGANSDSQVERVSELDLNAVEIGAPLYYGSFRDSRRFITDAPTQREGRLPEGQVVAADGDGIWQVRGGRRHWVSSWDAYLDLGRQLERPASLNNRWVLRGIPQGYSYAVRPLSPEARAASVKTGDVVHERGTLWYIQGGEKHYISAAVWIQMGHKPDAKDIPAAAFATLPRGADM
jgi:hypothetical protein